MSDCNTITKVLLRGGTDQGARYRDDLDPDSLQLHGFGITEWMKFAYEFAKHVNYFDTSSFTEVQGDWTDFFKSDEDLEDFLAELEESDQLTPHLTLFVCFLKLIDLTSDRFNKLTRRHLDFYYGEGVLQIEKLPAQFDKVHVLFELAKQSTQVKLGTDTFLNGGKDGDGNMRVYHLSEEFVANKATIEELRAVYFAHDTVDSMENTVARQYIKAAQQINSANGLGEALNEENPIWYPFGYHHLEEEVDSELFAELPNANLGFSLSSPVLLLTEGDRHLQFTFTFSDTAEITSSAADLVSSIRIDYTGTKNWVGDITPKLASTAITDADRSTLNSQRTPITYTTALISDHAFKLYVNLDSGAKPTAAYDAAIHQAHYTTEHPVFRFFINTSTAEGLALYEAMTANLEKVEIDVQVEEMANVIIENDHGTQNAKKPLFPFSSLPVKGSSLTVYHNELASKQWTSAGAYVVWKNNPEDITDWYSAYKQVFTRQISSVLVKGYLEADDISIFADRFETVGMNFVEDGGSSFPESLGGSGVLPSSSKVPLNAIVQSDSYFTGTVYVKSENTWKAAAGAGLDNVVLFNSLPGANADQKFCLYRVTKGGSDPSELQGLRISLNQSFLHEMYPQLYALSIAKSVEDPNQAIPNVPYTPLSEEIRFFYTAKDSVEISTADSYEESTLQLYHELPFGQAAEHIYLRQLYKAESTQCSLTPKFERGGELYIGLKNAVNLQNVSLLVQVLEGSENPDTSDFSAGDQIEWHVLGNNYWKKLDSTLLLHNGIDNFLQSGIVTFKLPKEATSTNTLLDADLVWVRAKLKKPFDAVCKVLGIHAQATLAEFTDNGNELSHLEKGIASGTIAKMIQRSSLIKSVTQPYNSFDGKAEEDDDAYYIRVSERLRHKNRSVTLWDYEHMTLQEFPDIYKVKCLNHTSCCSYVSPGHVMLVVIPDTVNKNVFDINKPMVSTARRNVIQAYIAQFTSLHVQLTVENPAYEELTVEVEVRFFDQYDESLYSQQLKDDIARFLSPWAYDQTEQVEFGVTLHKSVLVDYLEELYYVDYLDSVKMYLASGEIQLYEPSTPRSILVSSNAHIVKIAELDCLSSNSNSEEACQ